MFFCKRIFLSLLLLFVSVCVFAQLQIIPQTSAQALAQKLVGSGVTISNITLSGSPLSTAFFRNVSGTQLSLDSGIVLSTGRVLTQGSIYGLNAPANNLASSMMNTPGDPQLDALVSPKPTHDAVVLEFDFIPLGDTVKFRYVFSSDEYPTFNCDDYNDVFAFFISGPGIAGVPNIALVPGTNIPVAINSVNNGIPGGGGNIGLCSSMGPGSPFTQYYTNNSGNAYFAHTGHTKVFTAQSAVQPCQTYHLKIAIADVQDYSFDSGVFLEAESLRSDPIQIISSTPVINGLPYLVEGCQSGGIKIVRSRKSPTPQPVSLYFGGNAINGTDVQLIASTAIIPANDSVVFIPVIPIVDNVTEGTELLKIYVSNGCILNNFYLDSIEIQVRDYDTLSLVPTGNISLCRNVPQQLTAGGSFTTYQWTPSASLNNSSISNPIALPTGTTTYICTATIGNCHAQDSVHIVPKILDFVSKTDINCANGNTGQIKVSGGSEWKAPVEYSLNNGAYQADSSFNNLPAGNYMVRIRDASSCVDSMQINLVQAYPNLSLGDSITTASCVGLNGGIKLNASGGRTPYTYSVDASGLLPSPVFNTTGGNHTVTVQDANGCLSTHNVVITNDAAINFITHPSQRLCNGNPDGYMYINATGGSGLYGYSIDGTNFQAADSFFVTVTSLTIIVKDNKGCTAATQVNIPLNQAVFVNAGNDTTICEGSSLQFHTTYNAVTFLWTANNSLSATNIPDPVAAPIVRTTYYVTATKDVCVAKDSIVVDVYTAPVPYAGMDSSICYGKTIQLNGSGGAAYSWTPAAQVSNTSIANPSIRPLQNTKYYLKVFDIHGCPSLKYDTVAVTVVPAIRAFAGRDTIVTRGQPLQLNGSDLGNSGASIFSWSPAFGLNNPNILNPVATLSADMTYTLTLSTPEGCEGSDDIFIKVYDGPEIFVPSGFTPNGDGMNDLLRAIPVGMKEFHFFKIFNRWGQMIFSTATPAIGWNGMINGIRQPTGTYVWVAEGVDYKGNVLSRKGSVTLIR